MGNKGSSNLDNLATQRARRVDTPASVHLTPRQRRLVRNFWDEVFNDVESDFGVELFERMLPKSEFLRQVFGVPEDHSGDVASDGRLVSHARVVKHALNTYITAILDGKAQEVSSAIRCLGTRHAYFWPSSPGVRPEDTWMLFAQTLFEIASENILLLNRAVFRGAWNQVVYFVLINMQIGFKSGLQEISLPPPTKMRPAEDAATEREKRRSI